METSKVAQESFLAKKRHNALPPPPPRALCNALGVEEITVEWLAGDGSDRCYYRLSSPELLNTYVLMQLSGQDALALKENGYEWIQIGNILSRNDIFVPKTVATIPEFAAIVIEDYGNIMMESVAHDLVARGLWKELLEYYLNAFKIITKFLSLKGTKGEPWTKRRFDHERFHWELKFFQNEFLLPVTNIHLNHQEQKLFNIDAKAISSYLAESSNFFVHRDYHSRNLMIKNNRIAVIDFQDARFGPPSYDLVSLCFDSYVPLQLEKRQELVKLFLDNNKNLNQEFVDKIEQTWRPMLLQRQLKAIGSFGYLSIKKNHGNYLRYVKPAIQTLREDFVADSRWPFISCELINRIQNKIG